MYKTISQKILSCLVFLSAIGTWAMNEEDYLASLPELKIELQHLIAQGDIETIAGYMYGAGLSSYYVDEMRSRNLIANLKVDEDKLDFSDLEPKDLFALFSLESNRQIRKNIRNYLELKFESDPELANFRALFYDTDEACENKDTIVMDLLLSAALQNSSYAQFNFYSKMYESKQNFFSELGERSFEFLEKSAANGNPPSMEALARLLLTEHSTSSTEHSKKVYRAYCKYKKGDCVDPQYAMDLLYKASKLDNFYAQFDYFIFADKFKRGNSAFAVEMLKRAAEHGSIAAQITLAEAYYGLHAVDGIDVDYAMAARYSYQAANQGHADSMFKFGRQLETGIGITENKGAAIGYYIKAFNHQSFDAAYHLMKMYADTEEAIPYATTVAWCEPEPAERTAKILEAQKMLRLLDPKNADSLPIEFLPSTVKDIIFSGPQINFFDSKKIMNTSPLLVAIKQSQSEKIEEETDELLMHLSKFSSITARYLIASFYKEARPQQMSKEHVDILRGAFEPNADLLFEEAQLFQEHLAQVFPNNSVLKNFVAELYRLAALNGNEDAALLWSTML